MHWFRRPAVLGDHYDRSVLDELRFSRLFQDLGLNFVNNLHFTDPDDYDFKSTRKIANLDVDEDLESAPTATCYFGTAAVAGNGRDGERAQGSEPCRHSSSRREGSQKQAE